MKLNLDRINLLPGWLQNTTLAAILLTYPLATSAIFIGNIAQINNPQLGSVVSDNLIVRTGNNQRFSLYNNITIFNNQKPDPSPPIPEKPGGSY